MHEDSVPPFGGLLKKYRLVRGLTQEVLAERAGVSVRTIQALEHGTARPHCDTAERLVGALGLAPPERGRVLASVTAHPRVRTGSGLSPLSNDPHSATPRGDLRLPPTALLGREREVATVAALLQQTEGRLLTLTGPGGVGKTRLALEVARTLQGAGENGSVIISLAPLRDHALVLPTIARSLGVVEQPRQSLYETLVGSLGARSLLLLLDNCEHLLEAALEVAQMLDACPGLRVLATSRAALRLSMEQVFPVPPLALPDLAAAPSSEDLEQNAAVRLFVQRAQAVLPDFVLTEANAAIVAAICVRLDGLPLAIELAAARVAALPPRLLLARLAHPLHALTGGAWDRPERQRTLRATMAWSYDLLSPAEQALFRHLCVFAGSCTGEAVAAVCGDGTLGDPVEDLATLVGRSLLRVSEQPDGTTRYSMLETVRAYGREQLHVTGEMETLRRRHAAYFVALVKEARPHLYHDEQVVWLDLLDAEMDNLREALTWCLEQGLAGDGHAAEDGLWMAGDLYRFWALRQRYGESRTWLTRLLSLPVVQRPSIGRARALRASAVLMAGAGDVAAGDALMEERAALCRQLGDPTELACALLGLGSIRALWLRADTSEAAARRAHLHEAAALFRQLGEADELSAVLIALGRLDLGEGNLAAATDHLRQGLALARAHGDRWYAQMALEGLADVARIRGDAGTARALLEQQLALARALRDRACTGAVLGTLAALEQGSHQSDAATVRAYFRQALLALQDSGDVRHVQALWGVAALAAEAGDPTRALRLAGAATALTAGAGLAPPVATEHLAQVQEAARQSLSPSEQEMAWAAGQAMTLHEATAYALDAL